MRKEDKGEVMYEVRKGFGVEGVLKLGEVGGSRYYQWIENCNGGDKDKEVKM